MTYVGEWRERKREEESIIHITSVTVYYYTLINSILLLIANLLLCLIYKLSFITDTYVWEEHCSHRVSSV
jgi:hypothetical protein